MNVPFSDLPRNFRYGVGHLVMCAICQAIVSTDTTKAHEIFHDTYKHKDTVKTMSSAAWCDPGNHSFKAGEPGSQHFGGSTVNEQGIPERIEMDACAKHSFQPKGEINSRYIEPQDDVTRPYGGTKD